MNATGITARGCKTLAVLSVFVLLIMRPATSEERESVPHGLRSLARAYPGFIRGVTPDSVVLRNGTRLPYDDGRVKTGFDDLLDHASLFDQMKLPYGKGLNFDRTVRDFDPGRIRNEEFFRLMYGRTEDDVKRNLVPVRWLPAGGGKILIATSVNGVNEALGRIAEEIAKRPHLVKYADDPAGSYFRRTIRGTGRLSMHSFGIAVDLNPEYSSYWLDDLAAGKSFASFRNRIPMELVEIFERHGFIWGGKWYHYDTMHFEYRPELVTPEFSLKAGDGRSPGREWIRPVLRDQLHE